MMDRRRFFAAFGLGAVAAHIRFPGHAPVPARVAVREEWTPPPSDLGMYARAAMKDGHRTPWAQVGGVARLETDPIANTVEFVFELPAGAVLPIDCTGVADELEFALDGQPLMAVPLDPPVAVAYPNDLIVDKITVGPTERNST